MLTAGSLWMTATLFNVARAQKVVKEDKTVDLPTVAASSDLQPLLTEIIRGFEAETQIKIRVILGAESRLYSQIMEGASFEMFLSSDERFAIQLAEAGKTEGQGDVYAMERLAFYVPSESLLKADNFLGDIRLALRDGRLQRFAVADPKADPYGRLAEEVLRRKLVWEEIQPLLMIGEDVAQTAQIAASGAVQGALVAFSQAGQLMAARGGKFMQVSDTLCEPLKKRMVLLKGAGNTTRRFYRYMLSNKARESLRRYGFLIPAA
jgi:molybdate transport system substrate-binding protein